MGGGVPFYDDPSHSLAIATITLLSAVVRVPIILWSVSSQRVNSLFTRLVLRFLISRCAVLTCRDRSTLGLLASCGADPAHLQIVPDPVFAMDFEDERAGRQVLERAGWQSGGQERELIAFTPRTFRGRDGEAHTHYKPQTQSSYKKQIGVYAAVLDWAWENGYQPVFVPMNTVGADDDCIASKEIMQQAKYGRHALLIHENIHPRVVKGIYAQCKTGLVTRVHGAITSYISGCPVAMYAFDQKHFGVMELMKANQMIFDPAQQDAGDAIAILQKILGDHAGIVKKMQEDLVDLQARAGIPIQLLMQMHRRT